jgi:large subunit ribosomal protein L31
VFGFGRNSLKRGISDTIPLLIQASTIRKRMAATRQKGKNMKQGIHPDYKEVVFLDVSNNFSFKTRSTIVTKETIKWEDGQEYPLAKIETSSESHPFYTGTQKIMDTAGRVEKFRQKFGAKASAKKAS